MSGRGLERLAVAGIAAMCLGGGPVAGDTGPAPEPTSEAPRLRNQGPASLRAFREQVARQAAGFPDAFFLEVALPQGDRRIALTFDDGPDRRQTAAVLDVLEEAGARATFFVVGERARRHPALIQRIAAAGHAVGGHAYQHVWLSKLPVDRALREHIERTADVLEDILGERPAIYRPPYGSVTDAQITRFAAAGAVTVNWSVDSFDWWRDRTAAQIRATVLEHAHPGAIVLFHDAGGDRGATIAALPGIIAELQRRGYELVTVPELLAARAARVGAD